MKPEKVDLFVSYDHDDSEFVQRLVDRFRDQALGTVRWLICLTMFCDSISEKLEVTGSQSAWPG